ncbi:MAG: glycosyltransferase [Alphaproteobacteria bacterium]|nr:glycosyltransferase [Alphaproteobacteria bacterium]
MRIHVLVDLARTPESGGHVKCWERLASAAVERPDAVDLTVHFSGGPLGLQALSQNVRYVGHSPLLSTACLPFLSHAPDHTDLAPYHPKLARALAGAELIHTTDAYFAFARTALGIARRRGLPLVTSMHTDTPRYARIYARQAIERLVGCGRLGRLLNDRLCLPRRAEERMRRLLARHQAACDYVLVSQPSDRDAASAIVGAARVGMLRRGVDKRIFAPARRDRRWLRERLGIPEGQPVLLFVGRIDRGKSIHVLAEALAGLAAQGIAFHLVCAGRGPDVPLVLARLPGRASCIGHVASDEIGRLAASADLLAAPSEVEVLSNVVIEALASGTPVAVSAKSGMAAHFRPGLTGIVVDGDEHGLSSAWSAALEPLLRQPERLAAMAEAVRGQVAPQLPSWCDVLDQDLLPIWSRALGRATAPELGRDAACTAIAS